ncbi:SNF2 family N-terminal domain-containing protein, partial [Toxoplasma gondii ARI]
FDSAALHAAPCCALRSSSPALRTDGEEGAAPHELARNREEASAEETQTREGERLHPSSDAPDENTLFIEPQFLYDCLVRAWKCFAKQSAASSSEANSSSTSPSFPFSSSSSASSAAAPAASSSSSFHPFGELPSFVSPPGLRCSLRPYQQRAVFFALTREWRHLASLELRESDGRLPLVSSSSYSRFPCPRPLSSSSSSSPSSASSLSSSFSPSFSPSCSGALSAVPALPGARGDCGEADAPLPSVRTPQGRPAPDLHALRDWTLRRLRLPPQRVNLLWLYVPLASGRVLAFDSLFGRYKFLGRPRRKAESAVCEPHRENEGNDVSERMGDEDSRGRVEGGRSGVEDEEERKDGRKEERAGERDAQRKAREQEREEQEEQEEQGESEDEYACFDAPGGMLCDQMGLGKTVEAIALILLHPAPFSSSSSSSPSASSSSPSSSSSLPAFSSSAHMPFFSREEDLPPNAVFDCPCGFEGMRIRFRVSDSCSESFADRDVPLETDAGTGDREALPVLLPLGSSAAQSGAHAAKNNARRACTVRRGAKQSRESPLEEANTSVAASAVASRDEGTRSARGEEDREDAHREGGARKRQKLRGRASLPLKTEENGRIPALPASLSSREFSSHRGDAAGKTARLSETREKLSDEKKARKYDDWELLLPVIQCEQCRALSHLFCLGVTPEKAASLLRNFTCVYCESAPLFSGPEAGNSARDSSSSRLGLREVTGTLVLCPAAILQQWREEIEKHTEKGSLRRTAIYTGLKHARDTLRKQLLDSARRRFATHMTRQKQLTGLFPLPVSSHSLASSSHSSVSPSHSLVSASTSSTSDSLAVSAPSDSASSSAASFPENWLLADEEEMVLIRPEQLEDVDILLVSYDTLREELWFAPRQCRSRQYGGSASSRFSPLAFSYVSSPLSSSSPSSSRSSSSSFSSSRASSASGEDGADRRGVSGAFSHEASVDLSSSTQAVSSFGLRRRKRYRLLASPLLRVHWWRLLIDEAQMVG